VLAPGDLQGGTVSVERLTGWELVDPEASSSAPEEEQEDPRATVATGAVAPHRLTVEQEHAVGRRGEPLLLAAGAGSGKTSVLVERFVRAVREDGIAPERILAITFTERAAGELRERVRARLAQLEETAAARALDGAFIGTFHGFCARILRAHAREAGLGEESAHEILDEGLAGRLRRRAFAQALGEFVGGGREEAVDLIAAYTADRARASVLGVYAELRSRGQRSPRLPAPQPGRAPVGQAELLAAAALDEEGRAQARAAEEAGARAIVLWDELLGRFGECYEAAKRAREGVDFDDLELLAGELLAGDAQIRSAWAERFELLMVDELQDVNPRQLQLVSMLERENLFTVGDEWQSIYGFRHADVNLFRDRHARLAPLGQSLRLAHNFRGRPELLAAVNAVFARRFGETYIPLRAGRESEREASAQREPQIELLLSDRRGWGAERGSGAIAAADAGGSGATDWREAEALALARRVRELVEEGRTRAGQVAVLLRGMGDIDCYEQALRGQGLPTLASAGSFWARQEVADLLAYLRALADPADELALYGVLAAPPVGLPSDALALLARVARERECGVWEVVRDLDPPVAGAGARAGDPLSAGERERAAAYCAWLQAQRLAAGELTLAQLLERAVQDGDHVARLRTAQDGPRRLANVDKLIGLAGEWERSEGRDLRGFLDEAAFQQGAGSMGFLASAETTAEPDAAPAEEDAAAPADAVRLMSVHAAKGLEFDVVCVADLGRAPSTGVPDLLVDGDRVGVRLLQIGDPEPRPALDYAQLAQERREAQALEEDRIAYVAMTRARERLLLSGAVDFAGWPRERPGAAPIAWLGPALAPELPALCAEAVRHPSVGGDSPAGGGDRTPGERTGGDPLAPVLCVDGTDVPLRCRLNTPLGAA
jgi:ATP-dependent exoDNAse (exonuclease V) beta subunit